MPEMESRCASAVSDRFLCSDRDSLLPPPLHHPNPDSVFRVSIHQISRMKLEISVKVARSLRLTSRG